MLASTGMIGPFLVPALLLLGLHSDVARGTTIVSELLMTCFSVIVHRNRLDKRVILAFLPGALTVFLGANASLAFQEELMKKAIGVFEVVIGTAILLNTRWSRRQYTRTVDSRVELVVLMLISVLAGFAKGFFGAGWGPLGIGLFLVAGLDPSIVVGSSLTSRVVLDVVGGVTYLSMNSVDYNVTVILTVAGCTAALLSVKWITAISKETLSLIIGLMVVFLGVVFSAGL